MITMPKLKKKKHKCGKKVCVSAEIRELTKCYKNLRCLRKQAKEVRKLPPNNLEFELTDEEIEWFDCKGILEIRKCVDDQREKIKLLMIALRDINGKLADKEEELCQTDKRIESLDAQVMAEKQYIEEQKCEAKTQLKLNKEQLHKSEIDWRDAMESEILEQNKVKAKIRELKCTLEKQCSDRKCAENDRQKRRTDDTKILIDAVDRVDVCLQDCMKLLEIY